MFKELHFKEHWFEPWTWLYIFPYLFLKKAKKYLSIHLFIFIGNISLE